MHFVFLLMICGVLLMIANEGECVFYKMMAIKLVLKCVLLSLDAQQRDLVARLVNNKLEYLSDIEPSYIVGVNKIKIISHDILKVSPDGKQ